MSTRVFLVSAIQPWLHSPLNTLNSWLAKTVYEPCAHSLFTWPTSGAQEPRSPSHFCMLRPAGVRRLQRRVLLGGGAAAAGLLAAYRGDANELHFDAATAAQQALQLLDAERAHNMGLWAAKHGLTPRERGPDLPALRTAVWGRQFPNPIGVQRCFAAYWGPCPRTYFAELTACMHADTPMGLTDLLARRSECCMHFVWVRCEDSCTLCRVGGRL
jgi:hypothetical protein